MFTEWLRHGPPRCNDNSKTCSNKLKSLNELVKQLKEERWRLDGPVKLPKHDCGVYAAWLVYPTYLLYAACLVYAAFHFCTNVVTIRRSVLSRLTPCQASFCCPPKIRAIRSDPKRSDPSFCLAHLRRSRAVALSRALDSILCSFAPLKRSSRTVPA